MGVCGDEGGGAAVGGGGGWGGRMGVWVGDVCGGMAQRFLSTFPT